VCSVCSNPNVFERVPCVSCALARAPVLPFLPLSLYHTQRQTWPTQQQQGILSSLCLVGCVRAIDPQATRLTVSNISAVQLSKGHLVSWLPQGHRVLVFTTGTHVVLIPRGATQRLCVVKAHVPTKRNPQRPQIGTLVDAMVVTDVDRSGHTTRLLCFDIVASQVWWCCSYHAVRTRRRVVVLVRGSPTTVAVNACALARRV